MLCADHGAVGLCGAAGVCAGISGNCIQHRQRPHCGDSPTAPAGGQGKSAPHRGGAPKAAHSCPHVQYMPWKHRFFAACPLTHPCSQPVARPAPSREETAPCRPPATATPIRAHQRQPHQSAPTSATPSPRCHRSILPPPSLRALPPKGGRGSHRAMIFRRMPCPRHPAPDIWPQTFGPSNRPLDANDTATLNAPPLSV